MASKKTHKAMDDREWLTPRQKSGHQVLGTGLPPGKKNHKIKKCPLQLRGQRTLVIEPQGCSCGFHTQKVPPAPGASSTATGQSSHSSTSDVSSPAHASSVVGRVRGLFPRVSGLKPASSLPPTPSQRCWRFAVSPASRCPAAWTPPSAVVRATGSGAGTSPSAQSLRRLQLRPARCPRK